jgi:cell division protein FtsI/penicillin-binding protein 2
MVWRYRFILVVFLVLFLLVISRLFYWQIVRSDELASLGQAQYGRQVALKPERGEIKTSDGFAIAANKLTYLVFANPKEIKDKDKNRVVETLAPMLEVDTASISPLLNFDRFWVPLKTRVENKVKNKIEAIELAGIGFQEQDVRFYPEASMAAHMLGFVGKDDKGEDKGYFGLEGHYERQLRGKSGVAIVIHDASGRPILEKMGSGSVTADGKDLILHVDRTIQFILDRELKKGIEAYGAIGGMAAVMDPKTGGILAMSSFPTFDPRQYTEYSYDLYRNPFISNTYEPGSTFKPLIMAAALEEKLIKPETICDICGGPIQIGEYQINTWNNKYAENSTMTEVIQHSDNTGMVYVGRKLGLDRMISYIKKFGIGEMTGIDLQGEAVPALREKNQWYPIDLATATFGQGITVAPIELLTAFSAIANGGQRMEPHVVASIQTQEGKEVKIPPKVLNRPISSKTAKIMTEMMVNAVDKGESKWAKPKGYRIAGKTGTAQIPVEGHYDPNKTITSFIGFAPADDPKFLMLVVIDRPTTSIYGSETAAPLFFKAAKNILNYYGISPTE